MTVGKFDIQIYLDILIDCADTVRESDYGGFAEIPDHKVEKECGEAVADHDEIGAVDAPRRNAAIVAFSAEGDDVLAELDPSVFDDGTDYIAEAAHRAAKSDVLSWVIDERKEIAKEAERAGESR